MITMGSRATLFGLYALSALTVHAAQGVLRPYELTLHRDPESLQCSHLILRDAQPFRALPDEGYLKSKRLETGEERIKFIARDDDRVWALAEALCGAKSTWNFQTLIGGDFAQLEKDELVLRAAQDDPLPLEVEPLETSGDPSKRVDLVFFADGYTAEEKDKFLADARRLAEEVSGNQTFNTVKPLLNFWAAFTPSNESGIGVGGQPKDTAFGLYRDGTELRGVYYSKPEVAREACFSLGDQCDYPILVGNDPLYGGLGGEFTVITPSVLNGPLILRHELGHSIIDVGEEYDGSDGYFGVNAAQNTSLESLPWVQWLSNATNATDARIERSVMPLQDYAWTLLNTSAPWSTTFNSSGTYPRHLVQFSLSGLPEADDLVVELDGNTIPWTPREDIGVDRWFYETKVDETLSDGEHEIKFTLKNKEREGEAQLCSVEILEFGGESEFVSTPGYYGLFPTFDYENQTTYRPTNDDCLMRKVTTPNFCKACREGLWHALLRRVSLIDELTSNCSSDASTGETQRILEVTLVPLAQLRDQPVNVEESYEITWLKDDVEFELFKNKTQLVDDGHAVGNYTVTVQYRTEEVRVDPDGLLKGEARVVVDTTCGCQ